MHPLFFATWLLSTMSVEHLLCWDPGASIITLEQGMNMSSQVHTAASAALQRTGM